LYNGLLWRSIIGPWVLSFFLKRGCHCLISWK